MKTWAQLTTSYYKGDDVMIRFLSKNRLVNLIFNTFYRDNFWFAAFDKKQNYKSEASSLPSRYNRMQLFLVSSMKNKFRI